MIEMSIDEWNKAGEKLFGEDRMRWRFKCPSCGWVARTQDYRDAGAPAGAVGFSCIGRYLDQEPANMFDKPRIPRPCNYAGGGLIGLNPIDVYEIQEGEKVSLLHVFQFAPYLEE